MGRVLRTFVGGPLDGRKEFVDWWRREYRHTDVGDLEDLLRASITVARGMLAEVPTRIAVYRLDKDKFVFEEWR